MAARCCSPQRAPRPEVERHLAGWSRQTLLVISHRYFPEKPEHVRSPRLLLRRLSRPVLDIAHASARRLLGLERLELTSELVRVLARRAGREPLDEALRGRSLRELLDIARGAGIALPAAAGGNRPMTLAAMLRALVRAPRGAAVLPGRA